MSRTPSPLTVPELPDAAAIEAHRSHSPPIMLMKSKVGIRSASNEQRQGDGRPDGHIQKIPGSHGEQRQYHQAAEDEQIGPHVMIDVDGVVTHGRLLQQVEDREQEYPDQVDEVPEQA